MRPIRSKPDYKTLPEYQLASEIGGLITATVNQHSWSAHWQWLQTRLLAEADSLTRTLTEGYSSDFVAEWALGLGSCRNAALMSDYILTFLRDQGMFEEFMVDPILDRLEDLMSALLEVSQDLRQTLTVQKRAQLI